MLKAAKAAGYRQSAMVNALMTQVRQRAVNARPSGDVIAYLHSYEREDLWLQTPSLKEQYEGAHRRGKELGFNVQPFWIGHRGSLSRNVARVMRARGIRGAIIAPVSITQETHLELNWPQIVSVAISYTFSQQPVSRVVHHHLRGISKCFSKLARRRYKRIGLAIGGEDNMEHIWMAGYLASQQVHRTARLPILIMETPDAPDAFVRWYKRHKPDAVISVHGHGHLPLQWLQELGLSVPEEVGYASLDVSPNFAGKIAGTLQDNIGMGEVATAMVVSSLLHNEIGLPDKPTITMIDGKWIDGPTARAL